MKRSELKVALIHEMGECMGEIMTNVLATVLIDAQFEELAKVHDKEVFDQLFDSWKNFDDADEAFLEFIEEGKKLNCPEMNPVFAFFREKVQQMTSDKRVFMDSIKKQYRLKYEV